MSKTIADSIIIRVGKAIMEIPRNINTTQKSKIPTDLEKNKKKKIDEKKWNQTQ